MDAGAWTVAREDWRSRSDDRRAMVSDPSPPPLRSGATGGLYRRFVEPLLRTDEGADAEQLSRISLGILQETSLRRDWPVVRDTLQGLAL